MMRGVEQAQAQADEARQKPKAEASPSKMPRESPPAEQGEAQEQQDVPFTVMSTMLSLATELLKRKRTTVRLLRAA